MGFWEYVEKKGRGSGMNLFETKQGERVNELEREKKDLIAQVNALKELLIECTDNGELDGRLLSSYMEHYINNS